MTAKRACGLRRSGLRCGRYVLERIVQMEEIEQRLQEATANCLAAHTEWNKNRKDSATREKLMESVHELRKVAARLEIEIAISERDEMAAKPIPIPPHRSSNRRRGGAVDDNIGNDAGDAQPQERKPARSAAEGLRPRRRTGTGQQNPGNADA